MVSSGAISDLGWFGLLRKYDKQINGNQITHINDITCMYIRNKTIMHAQGSQTHKHEHESIRF